MILEFVIAVLFSAFVAVDILSLLPRAAGSISGYNGIAYTFQVMVNALKRIFIVSYAPLLGLLAIVGDIENMFRAIFFSLVFSVVAALLVFRFRVVTVAYFSALAEAHVKTGTLLPSARAAVFTLKDWRSKSEDLCPKLFSGILKFSWTLDRKTFLYSLWIFLFYSSAIFFVNILGKLLPDWSSILYQVTGLLNAFGTLALAFLLDPRLSHAYENKKNLVSVLYSLILGRIVCLAILSPLVFGLCWYFVVF